MRYIYTIIIIICFTIVSVSAQHGNTDSKSEPISSICSISDSSIFNVKLGETLKKINDESGFRLERTSDGDGAALVSVYKGDEEIMEIWANEGDPDSAINLNKTAISIQTFNMACSLKNGLHPGATISDIQKIYGNDLMIELTEIESREYVRAKSIPEFLEFRVDGAGVFGKDRMTKDFNPSTVIQSITINKTWSNKR